MEEVGHIRTVKMLWIHSLNVGGVEFVQNLVRNVLKNEHFKEMNENQ